MRLLAPLLLLLAASCVRAPLKGPENAMRKTSAPELADDLPLDSLLQGVDSEVQFLEKSGKPEKFVFGERVVPRDQYLAGLKRFIELGRTSPDAKTFLERVRDEFEFYEVYGQKKWGEAFITSYFEPYVQGSLKPSDRFTQPVYGAPADLVALDLSAFDPKYEQDRKLRGRVVGNKFVPYFSREEIDAKGALKGRKLEICWLDPVDAFFLQTQGSGTVDLGGGKSLRLNYAEKNGHLYEQLAKFLKPYIPIEQMNLHTIEAYLRKLPRADLQKVLNQNPSYVFFKPQGESATTFLGTSAVDGRTIATDRRYFPKGALGFLVFDKPVFAGKDDPVPASSMPASRFVLDQDVGGAITGAGRLDLFWGRGEEAKRYAGAMKSWGKLYYLVPKER